MAGPAQHRIDRQDGKTIYSSQSAPEPIPSIDRATAFQLKSILQGVVARGTAGSQARLAPYIAGKTGTSDNENDAWFVGFSNDVTIAVWVGYDNEQGRRTLGSGRTGSTVALPIFVDIMEKVWASHAPRTELRGPSPDADERLLALQIDLRSGQLFEDPGRSGFTEYFHTRADGVMVDTRQRLVSYGQAAYEPYREPEPEPQFEERPGLFGWPPRRYDNPFFGPPRSESWRSGSFGQHALLPGAHLPAAASANAAARAAATHRGLYVAPASHPVTPLD